MPSLSLFPFFLFLFFLLVGISKNQSKKVKGDWPGERERVVKKGCPNLTLARVPIFLRQGSERVQWNSDTTFEAYMHEK